jgi:hypothetical protein
VGAIIANAAMAAPRSPCDLSLDHYLWTARYASRYYHRWRTEIRPDNFARADQMEKLKAEFNRANWCVRQLGGAPLPAI